MAEEKKIIIDEDWKAQVQAEKEAATKSKPATAAAEDSAAGAGPGGDMPLPPASFELLLTMLATEALVSLGQVAHPATGQVHVNRGQAQYLIDMIEMLREKTKGNLTSGEQQLTDTLLHQLRMAFVETANQPGA
jgi:hypothetical protein